LETKLSEIKRGSSPLIASAIHGGTYIREELKQLIKAEEKKLRREEDHYTERMLAFTDTFIIKNTSRFQIDINRLKEEAFYISKDDSFGIDLWKKIPPQEEIERSLKEYDGFYDDVRRFLNEQAEQYGKVILLDIHSYNYKNDDGSEQSPAENPEINISTAGENMERWRPFVNTLIEGLRDYDFHGRSLDVRENVKFKKEGNFSQWIKKEFPESVCAMTLEIKKFYMDELTGEPYEDMIEELTKAIAHAGKKLLKELERVSD
jgi:hypothetical protein